MEALQNQFGGIDYSHAETGEFFFRHMAYVHFVQTNAVEDFHGLGLSGETPRHSGLSPVPAGVKPGGARWRDFGYYGNSDPEPL